MNFESPGFLLALIFLIPPAFIMMFVHFRRSRPVLSLFRPSQHERAPGSGELRFRYWFSSLAFLVTLFCAVIALAGPRWGFTLVPEYRQGIDVALVMDLSRSMNVRDGDAGESRLERAGAIAGALVAGTGTGIERPGVSGRGRGGSGGTIRYAAVIGKGQGVLAIPLTEDTEAVLSFINGISSAAVTGRGTNLESLIDTASMAFKDNFPGRRRIILFSDGETLSGNLSAAVNRALARDISVIAVCLGAESGGPVPGEDGDTGVISYARPDALRTAARTSGGIYLHGGEQDAAETIIGHLASLSFGPQTGSFRQELTSRRYIFILAALAAFGISKFLGVRRKRRG
jgi:Ca-activated chloride channel family protein